MAVRGANASPWWKDAIVYQIYPRSFADGNGDGVGDLDGVRGRLDHLSWLGVDTLWLSPIFTSPMADFGYDVADYCNIDPLFGSLTDFDALLDDIHGRNMRLLLDWVPNHTSDQHPWFLDARSGRDAATRDWYVWRDPAPDGGPPNNWAASITDAPAWTFDEASGQYYLHLFLSSQPDLNWANPEVEAAMHDTLRFWLDRGVDGFRADVLHCIGKDPTLPDDPPEFIGFPHCAIHDETSTHDLLRRIRTLLDSYPQQPMMVGEVYLLDTDLVVKYLGDDDELHLTFNFMPTHAPWNATAWRTEIARAEAAHDRVSGWPTWVLSNHDLPRHRTRYSRFPNAPTDDEGSEQRARAAAVLLLTLRGTPFLYQGEELGLLDAEIPPDRAVDPGGRDGCRAPIPWDATSGHGWVDPWLPLPGEAAVRNVEALTQDGDSILHLYRRLIAMRTSSRVLREGEETLIDLGEHLIGYRRFLDDDSEPEMLVIVNTDDVAHSARASGSWSCVLDSMSTVAPLPFTGILQARQAVVLTSA